MTTRYLIVFILVLVCLKFLSMLVIFILKVKYSGKDEGQRLCSLEKKTYLEYGNEYDYWYIIPSITFYYNIGFGITFQWLKINYGHFWKVLTFDEEDLIVRAKHNKTEQQ